MNKFIKIFAMTLLVCGISISVYGDNDEIEAEKDKLDQMQNDRDEVLGLIEDLQSMKSDAEAYVKELDKALEEYATEVYELQLQIEEKEGEIEQTKLDIIAAEEDIAKQYEDMKLRIQYMYENGEISDLQMIFDSANMADMLNRAEYINKITEYDRTMLIKLENAKKDLDDKQARLEEEKEQLASLQQSAQAKYDSTEMLIAEKQTVITSCEGELDDAHADVEAYDKEIEAQEQLIKELEEIERRRKELENLKLMYDGGQMRWPLPGYYRLSDDYGMRPDPFGRPTTSMHNGIDIPAPAGTPIIAAYDGQVAWSYYNWSAGNWVGIDHGNGVYTVYMHMSKMLVTEGQYVKQGDVIGLVGTTGSSTGNHLHFAVRLNGSYVNPHNYVSTVY